MMRSTNQEMAACKEPSSCCPQSRESQAFQVPEALQPHILVLAPPSQVQPLLLFLGEVHSHMCECHQFQGLVRQWLDSPWWLGTSSQVYQMSQLLLHLSNKLYSHLLHELNILKPCFSHRSPGTMHEVSPPQDWSAWANHHRCRGLWHHLGNRRHGCHD